MKIYLVYYNINIYIIKQKINMFIIFHIIILSILFYSIILPIYLNLFQHKNNINLESELHFIEGLLQLYIGYFFLINTIFYINKLSLNKKNINVFKILKKNIIIFNFINVIIHITISENFKKFYIIIIYIIYVIYWYNQIYKKNIFNNTIINFQIVLYFLSCLCFPWNLLVNNFIINPIIYFLIKKFL